MGPALRALEIPGEGTAGVASGSPRPWGVWGDQGTQGEPDGAEAQEPAGCTAGPPHRPHGDGHMRSGARGHPGSRAAPGVSPSGALSRGLHALRKEPFPPGSWASAGWGGSAHRVWFKRLLWGFVSCW